MDNSHSNSYQPPLNGEVFSWFYLLLDITRVSCNNPSMKDKLLEKIRKSMEETIEEEGAEHYE